MRYMGNPAPRTRNPAMTRFHMPIKRPEEIIPRLGKGERHWKKGRSAYELATTWMQAGDIPPAVRSVLQQAAGWQQIELIDGIFERETDLPGRGWPSQTDLLAIVKTASANAILGVEGKVDETFGPLVDQWLANARAEAAPATGKAPAPDNSNRRRRLESLCASLQIDPRLAGRLYYQLVHRTCAVVYEAGRLGYGRAVMLVHSFAAVPASPLLPAGFAEFSAFAGAVGMPVARPNAISPAKLCEGIELRLAWVSDGPSTRRPPRTLVRSVISEGL